MTARQQRGETQLNYTLLADKPLGDARFGIRQFHTQRIYLRHHFCFSHDKSPQPHISLSNHVKRKGQMTKQ
jgi:hypothetical protein